MRRRELWLSYGNDYTGTQSGNADTDKSSLKVARAAFLSKRLSLSDVLQLLTAAPQDRCDVQAKRSRNASHRAVIYELFVTGACNSWGETEIDGLLVK